MLVQNINDGQQVGTLGNRSRNITVIVKDCQPGTHAVPGCPDVIRIYLMILQLFDDIRAVAALIHQADEGRTQLAIGNILCHIAANTAMNTLNPACISASGNEVCFGIPLHIHEDGTNNYNTHIFPSSLSFIYYITAPPFCNKKRQYLSPVIVTSTNFQYPNKKTCAAKKIGL